MDKTTKANPREREEQPALHKVENSVPAGSPKGQRFCGRRDLGHRRAEKGAGVSRVSLEGEEGRGRPWGLEESASYLLLCDNITLT